MDENIPLYTSVRTVITVRIYVPTYIKTELLISSIIHEHFLSSILSYFYTNVFHEHI